MTDRSTSTTGYDSRVDSEGAMALSMALASYEETLPAATGYRVRERIGAGRHGRRV